MCAAMGMAGGDEGGVGVPGMMPAADAAAAAVPAGVDLRGENPLMAFIRTMLPWVNVGEMNQQELEGLAEQVLAQQQAEADGQLPEDFDE